MFRSELPLVATDISNRKSSNLRFKFSSAYTNMNESTEISTVRAKRSFISSINASKSASSDPMIMGKNFGSSVPIPEASNSIDRFAPDTITSTSYSSSSSENSAYLNESRLISSEAVPPKASASFRLNSSISIMARSPISAHKYSIWSSADWDILAIGSYNAKIPSTPALSR